MEISLTQIIILLIMLLTLAIYSYITWKKFGKDSVDEIMSVSEPPKEISAIMAAYIRNTRLFGIYWIVGVDKQRICNN